MAEPARFANLVRTGSKGLQTLVTTGSWSTQGQDELDRINKLHGYDKITHDKGMWFMVFPTASICAHH